MVGGSMDSDDVVCASVLVVVVAITCGVLLVILGVIP